MCLLYFVLAFKIRVQGEEIQWLEAGIMGYLLCSQGQRHPCPSSCHMLHHHLCRRLKMGHPAPSSQTSALSQDPGGPLCLKVLSRGLHLGSFWHLAWLLSGTQAEWVSAGKQALRLKRSSPELSSGRLSSLISVWIRIRITD